MSVVILTEVDYATSIVVNKFCRARNIKFISTDVYGVFGRVFNDFGNEFEVLDKNGEEQQEVMIESISNAEEGIVQLLKTVKHKFEDGEEVLITKVDGMDTAELGDNAMIDTTET